MDCRLDLASHCVPITLVLVKNEGCGISTSLEVGVNRAATSVSGLHRLEANRRVFRRLAIGAGDACYRASGRILAEEFLVRQTGIVELVVVILGPVKELTVGWVHLVIVLRELHIKVIDPAQLSVDVSLLRKLGVVRHASTLYIVLFVGVKLALWMQQNALLVLEVFVEVLL